MKISYLADCHYEADKIAQWYFDEWAHTVPGITVEDVREKVYRKALSRHDFPLIIVVHSGNELVAAAELKFRENKQYPEYEHWLGGVFVPENERGKGYSTLLIDKAKRHVRQLNIDTLYLQCEEKNINLYLKHGFRVLHSATHNGVQTTIMGWDVNA